MAIGLAQAAAVPAIAKKPAKRFDLDNFVVDCILANQGAEPQLAVLEVLQKAVKDHKRVLSSFEPLQRAGITPIHRSDTLTIFSAVWTPQMNLMPHDHLMWANIGIYSGREDNIFWERTDRGISANGAEALFEGDAARLPTEAIHSVTNPLLRFTGGIHIYGGDFFNTTRTQWNPETLEEEPSDGDAIRKMFERENVRLGIS
jgi:predicted metal-dependent enzyme (double-stranded beta helix superfamily)